MIRMPVTEGFLNPRSEEIGDQTEVKKASEKKKKLVSMEKTWGGGLAGSLRGRPRAVGRATGWEGPWTGVSSTCL